jgi:hypothetical protein
VLVDSNFAIIAGTCPGPDTFTRWPFDHHRIGAEVTLWCSTD